MVRTAFPESKARHQSCELVGTLSAAFMEANLFMRLAIRHRPVASIQHPGGGGDVHVFEEREDIGRGGIYVDRVPKNQCPLRSACRRLPWSPPARRVKPQAQSPRGGERLEGAAANARASTAPNRNKHSRAKGHDPDKPNSTACHKKPTPTNAGSTRSLVRPRYAVCGSWSSGARSSIRMPLNAPVQRRRMAPSAATGC